MSVQYKPNFMLSLKKRIIVRNFDKWLQMLTSLRPAAVVRNVYQCDGHRLWPQVVIALQRRDSVCNNIYVYVRVPYIKATERDLHKITKNGL
jgi:hypothetical protein